MEGTITAQRWLRRVLFSRSVYPLWGPLALQVNCYRKASEIIRLGKEWTKAGDRLTFEHKKPREKQKILPLNRAYTESQLKLQAYIRTLRGSRSD